MVKNNDHFWAALLVLGASLQGCDDGRTIAGLVRDTSFVFDDGGSGADAGARGPDTAPELDASDQDGAIAGDPDADVADGRVPPGSDGGDASAGPFTEDANVDPSPDAAGDEDSGADAGDDAGADPEAGAEDAGDEDAATAEADWARRRRAAALRFVQLQPNGSSPPLSGSLSNRALCAGECGDVTGAPLLSAFCDDLCAQLNSNADLRNFCYGGPLCSAIVNADLKQFCYGNCAQISNTNPHLQHLCRGDSSCALITTDFRLQAFCSGECELVD